MANRPAPALLLRDGDREELLRLTRSSRAPAGLALRARIVLLAADGVSNTTIADGVGVSRPTVIAWRDRYQAKGIAGLHDEDRSGRPRRIDRAKVIAVTLAPPPKKYGVTHWSSRLLARHLKISDHAVASIWREHGIQPWRSKSFRFSTDPLLEAKVVDVVGLYLDPPENAIVLSVDEKSQIHAFDRTAAMKPRHRHSEFLAFLRQIDRAYPERPEDEGAGELHLIMDNYAAHKHPKVEGWLPQLLRIHVHYAPTCDSWMNLVEAWFSLAERQAIHRGTYTSVK